MYEMVVTGFVICRQQKFYVFNSTAEGLASYTDTLFSNDEVIKHLVNIKRKKRILKKNNAAPLFELKCSEKIYPPKKKIYLIYNKWLSILNEWNVTHWVQFVFDHHAMWLVWWLSDVMIW